MAQTKQERNRQYLRETNQFLKEHGICTQCKKEKAMPGKNRCLVCLMDDRERSRKKYHTDADYRQKNIERSKAKRDERKKAGVCTGCGKNPPYNGRCLCYSCWVKETRRQKIHRQPTYRDLGLCMWCGAERVEGYCYCADCLEKVREGAAKANATSRKKRLENPSTHPWACDNRAVFQKRKEEPA